MNSIDFVQYCEELFSVSNSNLSIDNNDFEFGYLIDLPVNFATPLNVMSSIIVGSERPFALTANKIIRYELPGSKFSI